MRENKLRKLLQAGRPTLGTRLHNTWPAMVEAVGHSGIFDYVELLAEYAPYDAFSLENFCRAAELHNLGSMVKLDQGAHNQVIQAVAAGFESVMFANCRGAEDVRACVRQVRPETPADGGEFGAVMGRFTYMDYGGGTDYVQAVRDLVVVIMIEKRQAVEELETILHIPGVDMIQFGPADYAMSTGEYADRRAPAVQAVQRRVIQQCQHAGVAVRVELRTPDQAQEFLDMGVRHFNLGVDLTIYYNWLRQNGAALRSALNEAS